MQFDYIIKNGIVADFVKNTFSSKDIYVSGGRIVEGDGSLNAKNIVDAGGKYVLPGLIDLHAHYFYGGNNLGANADIVCPSQGITTGVDAGSAGTMNFDVFYRDGIMNMTTEVKAYISVSPEGVKAGFINGEGSNPADIETNYAEILKMFRKYPDVIKGLKLRIAKETTEGYGLEPLKKTVELANRIEAEGYRCIVAVHCGNLPEDAPIEGILELLRKGDSYTHVYQNLGEKIFNGDRSIKKALIEARERGVLFETGNGSIHWTLQNLTDAFAQGFEPDIISSDIVLKLMWDKPSFGLLHCMNTALLCGMDELSIFRAVTYSPAKAIEMLDEIGTLDVGTRADIAIVDIMPSRQRFYDRFGGEKISEKVFVLLMTLREGQPVFRQTFFY